MRKERSDYISEYGIEPVPLPPGSHADEQVTKPLKKHDLEDHIEALRGMDEQRRNSGRLRNYGIKVLEEWLKTELSEPEERSAADKVSRYARVIGILYRYRRADCDDKMPSNDLKLFFDQLINEMQGPELKPEYVGHYALAQHLYAVSGPPFLKKLKSHYLSVLFAAELMQALVAGAWSALLETRTPMLLLDHTRDLYR